MDRRTLFFVITLGFTLFFVNMFFDYQNTEVLQAQREQQIARDKIREKELVEEIAIKSVSLGDLPVVAVYPNAEGGEALTSGIINGEELLLLSWDKKIPESVYAGGSAYQLQVKPEGEGHVALYRREGSQGQSLLIGDLPDFGNFELQMVTPIEGKETLATPALSVDGRFISLSDELDQLRRSLGHEDAHEEAKKQKLGNSLVLVSHEGQWLPIAVYQRPSGEMLFLRDLGNLPTRMASTKKTLVAGDRPLETFYVLENEYQQLVISSYGGALSELNLPFQSRENTKSVVKEIEVGREMVAKHPYNARFPIRGYFTAGEASQGPFVEHEQGKLGGYYPLLRRDLIQQGARKSVRVPPEYYGLNFVSKYPELSELAYTVTYFDKEKIVLEASQSHRRITKTYTLAKEAAPYCFELTINIEGNAQGLWVTSGVPEVEIISGSAAPSLKYRITRKGSGEVNKVDLPTALDATTMASVFPDWLSNGNGFFGVIMDPLSKVDSGFRAQYVSGKEVPSRITEIGQDYERYKPESLPGYVMQYPLKNGTTKFRVFAGPYSTPILKAVDNIYTDTTTGLNPDYLGCQTFHGWFAFISEPFAKFLFLLMNFFHWMTGSWALSIVLLTIALKVMLYPLTNWSTKSMTKMQVLSPKIQAIQSKYKNDKKKAQLEIMNLYRESGVNPLLGCFPMLIQLPFLLGMFDLLKSSFQLRGASFIPGWIDNLTAPDVLFQWETPIPVIGNEFHLLPILLGLTMFLQMRMSSPLPKDKSLWTEQQRTQRTTSTMMPLLFTWMFYSFPSGLNIYWISSTLLGMLQQWWTTKQVKAQISPPSAPSSAKKTNVKGRRP